MGSLVIVGAGAIGTWLAVRASQVEELDVHLVARPERAAMFAASPPVVEVLPQADPAGHGALLHPSARLTTLSDPAGLPARPELAVIAVRAYQTTGAAALLSEHAVAPRAVLTLQNGLGNAETLAEVFGAHRTLAGTTTHGVTFVPPSQAVHAGAGETVVGPWSVEAAPLAADVVRLLGAASIPTASVADPRAAIWRKVAVNTAINPPTAIHGIENGRLLDGGRLEAELLEAAREAARVARAEGVDLDDEETAQAARTVAVRTARNRSSMLQARLAGRRLETDAITGEVVRRAARHGIAVPVNAAHLAALAALAARTVPRPA